MCRAHAAVRGLLREISEAAPDVAVADMEAGLEHLSRGTPRHVGTVLSVIEPYYRSMETGARVAELALELGIASVQVVANKVRDAADAEAVEAFCRARGLTLAQVVPDDRAVAEADRQARALLDHDAEAPAVRAVAALADRVLR